MTSELDFIQRDRLRERLLTLVHDGLLDRFEAEEQAASVGVTLNPSQDPNLFDPSSLPRWSMPMALAWVCFGSMPPVRSAWQHFKNSQFEWERVPAPLPPIPSPISAGVLSGTTPIGGMPAPLPPPRKQGWRYRRLSALSVSEMLRRGSPWRDEFKDGPYSHSRGTHGSYGDLIQALASGLVPSWGADMRTGTDPSPKPMTPEEWSFLILMEAGGQDAWGFRPDVPVFVNVLIDRVSLMDAFEPRVVEQDSDERHTILLPEDAEVSALSVEERRVRYRDFVVEVIKGHPEGPCKGCDRVALIKAGRNPPFNLKREEASPEFMEGQRLAAVPTWGKKGRRKK